MEKPEKTIYPHTNNGIASKARKNSNAIIGVGVYAELLEELKKNLSRPQRRDKKGFDVFKAEEKIGERLAKEVISEKKKEIKTKRDFPAYGDYGLIKIKKNISEAIQRKFQFIPFIEIPPAAMPADFAIPCFEQAKKIGADPINLSRGIADFISKIFGGENGFISRSFSESGYVNLILAKERLAEKLFKEIAKRKDGYGSSNSGDGEIIVLEYSSPNIAKPMNVGHLRSTIIGNSLKKIYDYSGYSVISLNYPGDWGTQFGKLIYALDNLARPSEGCDDSLKSEIEVLLNLYVRFHEEAEKNPELNEKAKEIFKKLEEGKNLELIKKWLEISGASLKEFQKVYERLAVNFDLVIGESFFKNRAEEIVKKCLAKKIAFQEKNGPVVADLSRFKLPSFVLKKSDGTTIFASREIASAEFRYEIFKPSRIIYLAGSEQTLHFKQVFKILELLEVGLPRQRRDKPEKFLHIDFGLVSLPEGRMSTRKGRIIFLEDLLDEAVKRAEKIAETKNPNLKQPEKKKITETIGIGAVIYADLSQFRQKNIVFSWDKALNLKGDSAPYLQYVYARIQSIIRKSTINNQQSAITKNRPVSKKLEKEEESIIFLLAGFPEIVLEAKERARPDIIANYLNNLAREFNRFYENIPVLNAPKDSRDFRLSLINAASQVLKNGLNLLGIKTLEKM